jgi:hypothetical protein
MTLRSCPAAGVRPMPWLCLPVVEPTAIAEPPLQLTVARNSAATLALLVNVLARISDLLI